MRAKIFLETERLLLRPFRISDKEAIFSYRGDPEITRFQLWEPFTREQVSLFIRKYQFRRFGSAGHWTGLGMELKKNNRLFGDVALRKTKDPFPQAEIGFNVAKSHQRLGYASEAVRALLDWLFTRQNVHRVYAVCDADNRASAALLECLGFRQEAHYRQNIWFKGHWGDELLFALLRQEWQQL